MFLLVLKSVTFFCKFFPVTFFLHSSDQVLSHLLTVSLDLNNLNVSKKPIRCSRDCKRGVQVTLFLFLNKNTGLVA